MPQPNLKIETERLIMRPFTLDDVEASYEMNLDPEISRLTGDGGVVSMEEIERRIREDVLGDYEKYGFGRLAVELKGQKEFIGFCGLKFLPDMKEVDLGFRFMRKYWGMGLATESAKACVSYEFAELGLERIIGIVLPENLASIRVLEKTGLVYERDIVEEGMLVRQYCIKGI